MGQKLHTTEIILKVVEEPSGFSVVVTSRL